MSDGFGGLVHLDLWHAGALLMAEHAGGSGTFAAEQALQVGDVILQHRGEDPGCAGCQGEVDECERLDSARRLILAWLVEQVDS